MVVEISCFASHTYVSARKISAAKFLAKHQNQYFNLPLLTNLGLEFFRFFKIPLSLTFFRSQPFLSKTKQIRKVTSFHSLPFSIHHKNISKFEFLSHQVCSTRRGTALSSGTFSKLPGTISKRLLVYLALTFRTDRTTLKETDEYLPAFPPKLFDARSPLRYEAFESLDTTF